MDRTDRVVHPLGRLQGEDHAAGLDECDLEAEQFRDRRRWKFPVGDRANRFDAREVARGGGGFEWVRPAERARPGLRHATDDTGRWRRASCAVRGRVDAKARPKSGSAAIVHMTVESPEWSASRPRSAAATPPTPIANPRVTPDAMPNREGRYSWPITTETLKDITVTNPISASRTPASTPSGASRNASSSGI